LRILVLTLIAVVFAWSAPALHRGPRLQIAPPAALMTDTVASQPANDIVGCASHCRRRRNGCGA
jgi:hypothetical protein